MTKASARDDTANALVEIFSVLEAERLSVILTPDDVETLRELVRAATPPNTLRAVASDLAYLEAWSRAATGAPLAFPPDEALGLKFIAQHLFLPTAPRAAGQGMPARVEKELRAVGVLKGALPHAPATVARRLASWRRVAQARGCEDALQSPLLRRAFSAARKASKRTIEPKSEMTITRFVLDQLIGGETTPGFLSLRELRDRTLLLIAFATGGRRRSELGGLLIENVFPIDQDSVGIHLGHTKTTAAQDGEHLVVTGRALAFLKAWLDALGKRKAPIVDGPIFRAIDRWGNLRGEGISGGAVNDILKARAKAAGLDVEKVSAHGLRSGYLTQASLQGIPIEQAIQHSKHRALQSAVRYYRDQKQAAGRAAKLAG